MITVMPGTTIECNLTKPGEVEAILNPLFMAGGLVLSQVSQLTGLEPYIIQNWVKRGYVSSPKGKKYSRQQFCRLIIINFLRETLQLDTITKLLSHINGHLDDESDDLIDDYNLYLLFTSLLCDPENVPLPGEWQTLPRLHTLGTRLDERLRDYREPYPGAKKRLRDVLYVMEVCYASALLKSKAENLLREEGM